MEHGTCTQSFDLVERFLAGVATLENMSSRRLIDNDRHFAKICLKTL